MPERKKSWTEGMIDYPGRYWGGNTREILRKKRAFEEYKKKYPKGKAKPGSAKAKPKPVQVPKTPAQIRSERAAALRGKLSPDFLKPLSEALKPKKP